VSRRREIVEFRAAWTIRLAVLAATLIWILVAVEANFRTGLPASAGLTAIFFVLFFAGFSAYFWSMAYVVDEYGVTYRGATDFRHYAWEDIVQVKDSQLPLGGWIVMTKRGGFVLSNFVRGKDRLVDLIVARAGLFAE